MFQRFKGFNLDNLLDPKLADEQAKQGRPAGERRTASGASAAGKKGNGRPRTNSALKADTQTPAKGPDPEEFVIGDDASDVSRVGTPASGKAAVSAELKEEESEKKDGEDTESKGKEPVQKDDELPEDVKRKLAKLETLTTRYQDLLRNYRVAHKRVSAIDPFEATLREHTPLATIADPGALVEFLNQRSLQSDMVMEELKRISGENKDLVKERDELKTKLVDAEKKAKDAFDEAAGLPAKESKDTESDPLGAKAVNDEPKKAAKEDKSDDFFDFDTATAEQKTEESAKEHANELSQRDDYINELSTENASLRQDLDTCQLNLSAMENKIVIKDREISTIQSELATAKQTLEAADTGDSSAIQTELTQTKTQLEESKTAHTKATEKEQEATKSLAQTETELATMKEKLGEYEANLASTHKQLTEKAIAAEENLRKYQSEHDENVKSGKYAQRDEKGMESLRSLVTTLREQAKKADDSKSETESRVNDLEFEIKRLEAEVSSSSGIISGLRHHESLADGLKKKLADAEAERDDAQKVVQSKNSHESAVASLRSQLKKAEKDRDSAYQMIVDCGKCAVPDKETDGTQTPTEPINTPQRQGSVAESAEATTPVDGEPAAAGEGKKKNKKKKSKAKKKPAEETPSVDELIKDPSKAKEILRNENPEAMLKFITETLQKKMVDTESNGEGWDVALRNLENAVEERDQTIRDKDALIRANGERSDGLFRTNEEHETKIEKLEAQIERLEKKLKGEEELQEEIETLRESLVDRASEETDAKHELKNLREQKQKLQEEFDELQKESDAHRKNLKSAESKHEEVSKQCTAHEATIAELKEAQSSAASSEELESTKSKLDVAEKERQSLQTAKEACEKQIEDLKAEQTVNGAELDKKHKSLTTDFDELKSKATGLEKDLAAANELAQTRFKDLTELRERMKQVQPELKKLKEETAELKSAKADLEKSSANVKKLEAKEKELKAEVAKFKTQSSEKEKEATSHKEKAKTSEDRSKVLEESYENARKDLEKAESTRNEAVEVKAKLQADLKKSEQELKKSKSSLTDLEKQVKKFSDEASSLREELQVTTAQHSTAQTSMESMQDQTRELATQMKEIKQRNESLDEELADAHRLLTERNREGDTIRRMLAEVEGRAESRVKEMRERMDLAVEERDRAEDEASSIGRRKARELDDLKTKLRDAEKESSRAVEAREDAERRERDVKTRHDDLERRATQAQEEIAEVRTAMSQLRDSLDESECQAGELEKEKADLRSSLQEREARLEKLQRSSKTMTEELRALQQTAQQQSKRSSVESARVASPVSKGGVVGNGATALTSKDSTAVDYMYLKNVLLQFMEQKDKKHQMQLVPVLGMLLHFDKQDEQKWMTAITAK